MKTKTCAKCGEQHTVKGAYCKVCRVRLGLDPFSAGKNVEPGPADFFKRQQTEPILDTWMMGRGDDDYE